MQAFGKQTPRIDFHSYWKCSPLKEIFLLNGSHASIADIEFVLAWLGDDVGSCWWIRQQEIIHIYWSTPRLTLFYSVSILVCISFMYNFDKMVRKQKVKYLDLASNRLAINSLNVLSKHSSDKSLCMYMRKSCWLGWTDNFWPLGYISIKFHMPLA